MSTTSRPQVYTGSQMFKSLTMTTGLPIDQVNFLIAQFSGLLFAIVYRKCLSHHRVSIAVRQITALIAGAIIGYFCFGQQIYNLLVLTTLSYIAILTCSPNVIQTVVLFVALMYLSYLHLLRLFHDYGGYTIDITGPIMIAVQKVTNVGFSLHDGLAKPSDSLNDEQKRYAIRKRPSFLEFYSYVFQFHTLMCGPLVFYNDYVDFIEGKNFTQHLENNSATNRTKQQPSPLLPALKKLIVSVTFAVLLVSVAPKFPITYLAEDKFLHETSFVSKIFYLLCATCVARFKYYHAWILGEVICNASGLGFNGLDVDGHPDWDLLSNIDIWGFENAPNLRMAVKYWNKTTQVWLRRTSYERNNGHKLLLTYILSALWHGFYPGYYLTFLGGAFFTLAARNVRRCLRPRFQQSNNKHVAFIYDICTYITTRVIMAYLVFPFVLLEFRASYNVYRSVYFFGHILGLIAIFILPKVLPQQRVKSSKDS